MSDLTRSPFLLRLANTVLSGKKINHILNETKSFYLFMINLNRSMQANDCLIY